MLNRLRIYSALFLLAFLVLTVRLFYWQILRGKDLSRKARLQHQTGQVLSAPRGNILASDGSWLAARSRTWLCYAFLPEMVDDKSKIADSLAPLLLEQDEVGGNDYKVDLLKEANRLKALFDTSDANWVPIKHNINTGVKDNIEALNIEGIGFEPEELRIYPEASSAAQLLGFVGKNEEGEDVGYFGLEGYYDLPLSGKPGFLSRESDAVGAPILFGDSSEISAIDGVDLLTHIDKSIQLNLDAKLSQGLIKYGASAGTSIVMDPKTGAILAMSSYPSYEPSRYYDFGDRFFKNPVVSDSFEPGSIFKVFVMAAALDSDVVKPDTKCDMCGVPARVDKYTIETWDNVYRPDSEMRDVIVHSDNVGMVFVGQKLGVEKLYDYLDKFGIGRLTNIDLQGEATPKLREKDDWSVVDLATASFGQGVAATPIQIITAVSAIANDGKIVAPQVVDKLIGNGWEEDISPVNEGEVISKKAADEITAMMVEAAKNGEAKWTHLRGFSVAGKTGTAQIPIAGHYDEEKTIASFIGYAPADDPKFVMIVTLREPQSSPWASETAAPLWYSIAKDLFLHFGIQPEN